MLAKPIRKTILILFYLVASVLACIGLIFLFSAVHGYSVGETADAMPFIQLTFALTCLCLPMAIYFIYRSQRSFRLFRSTYDIPEPPGRSTMFLIFAIVFSIATVIFLILCIMGMYP